MNLANGRRRFEIPLWGQRSLLIAACALAVGLQIVAIHAHSLSGDGAYHLIAGHQALRYGQNTVNFEHPPLVKLLVAIPSLLEPTPLTPPLRVEEALATATRVFDSSELIRRVTVRGRYVALILFIVPLFYACYSLGRRLADSRTGWILSLMIAFSLSSLPYLTVLQTDTAVTLAFLLTLLLAMRYVEQPNLRRASLLGLGAGFALAVKFSAVLLGPTVLLSAFLKPLPWHRRLGHLATMGLVVFLALEASYWAANRNYSSDLGREQIHAYCQGRGTLTVDDQMQGAEPALLAVERVAPRLAQWLTGFWGVRLQNAIGVYPSFAFGEVRSQGRWWYFPAVLAIKTPIAILLAALWTIGTASATRRIMGASALSPDVIRSWILLGVTFTVYMAVAMTSNYNLSVRHMLPVLPLLYLPVAQFLSKRPLASVALIGILIFESLIVAPLWMSQTNTWWLGARNPTRFALSAGNLEYRQNFIQLARHADRHGLEELKVLYPGLGREVLATYLPEAQLVASGDALEPGWYAVNILAEQFIPAVLKAQPEDIHNYKSLRHAANQWRPLWQAIQQQGEDHGYVASTFHLYRVADPDGGAAHKLIERRDHATEINGAIASTG